MTTRTTSAPASSRGGGRRTVGRSRAAKIRNVFLVVLVLALATVGGMALGGFLKVRQFDQNVARTDPFAGLTNRPGAGVSGAQTFLIIGSDSRDATLPGKADAQRIAQTGGQRSDTLMLMHVNKEHTRAYIVSIPRDSWVPVPAGGPWQGGRTKINAAFAYGGAKLVVRTVEGFTGVHIDHVVLINFTGFQKMTDAVGGVDVVVNKTTTDPETHATFHAGVNHLGGGMALYYVRQRHGLPGGDFDRVKRQQQFIRALMKKATDTGTLVNPAKLNALLDATAAAIIVDKQLSIGKTAVAFRDLRTSDISFITTPNLGTGREGAASVVHLDKPKALALFDAMSKDTMAEWLKTNPGNNVTQGS